MLKRITSLLLIMAVMVSIVTASGGKEAQGPDETQTITIAIQTHAMVSDYEDNYLTEYLENKLGVNLEFYLLPSAKADVRTNVSLLATSNKNLPDLLFTDALTTESVLSYGQSGVFMTLDDYVNDAELMKNFNAIPEEDRATMLRAVKMSDGHIYSMPTYEQELWNEAPFRFFINKAWLDKLGLDVPETTEELKEALIAFRDNDPNGNGLADEIGVYGYMGKYGQNVITALMNAFVYYDDFYNNGLALSEDGKVIAPFATDAWRTGLRYLNDLYKEGLLAPSIFTDTDAQFKARLNQDPGIVGFVSAGSLSNWPNAATNKNYLEMTFIPPLTGPDGISYTPFNQPCPRLIAFVFEGTKNPELALKVIDEFYDLTTSIIARYGEENVDWTRDPEILATQTNGFVEAGIFDSVAVSDITQIWYIAGNRNYHNVNPRYADAMIGNSTSVMSKEYNRDDPTDLYAKHYEWYIGRYPEQVLPPLYFTIDEVDMIQEAILNIPSFISQTQAEFITGTRDINSDADWAKYLSDLESMGLSKWLETAQTAYARTL